MANGGNDGVQNDDVELEAMRKGSFSWHPCHVSLRSTGFGLVLQFEDSYLEETILDKEEVLARVRVRSSPLLGDDCSSIQQGVHVLASKTSHAKGIFYDSQVEKAIQVRYSKRTHCRCSFTIKWLHRSLEGEVLTVPATAIMKLALKGINLHPTVSGFFKMLQSSNGSGALPFSATTDDMDWEMDINVLLDRQ